MSSKLSVMTPSLDAQFIENTNKFALELYKQIILENQRKNVVISPFSIGTCLSFAGMGAVGSTADEIFTGLKHGTASDKHLVADIYGNLLQNIASNQSLNIANKIYFKHGSTLRPNFQDIATASFRSEVEAVDFAENETAAKTINRWVEQKTNDKIKNFITPNTVNQSTLMVLVNAIHFKGSWTHPFETWNTMPAPFWTTATESVEVSMMHLKKKFKYGVFDELNMSALEMTYSDSDVSMLILLPNDRDGLVKLEENILNIDVGDILGKMYKEEVNVALPKFKIEFDVELSETLKKLGMGKMFSGDADFSDLFEQSESLCVSKIVHKAFIEVNEEGVEAAAATGMIMVGCCYGQQPTYFEADRPFLCLLQRNSQLMFVASIYQP
ncbi:serine protease inhibitor 42Dd-like [Uranotaenia lowii]|uniref:serine protease inhibitor 42Dd-like n=1 Tax=Uranotaenia lowii TaxID=190385 RepID=UPI0024784E9D|nr:serine protease inhibitor 42Dd-like [Uranotaenia lowii]